MTSKLKQILLLILIVTVSGYSMSKSGDLPSDEFARRRAIFLEELRDLKACAIFHTAPLYERNNGVEFPYRQDSDFYYLTGWTQTDGILVFTPQKNPDDHAEISLFVKTRDPKEEVWTGPKLGVGDARLLEGIDQAFGYDQFYDGLEKLISGYERLVIYYGRDAEFKDKFIKIFEASSQKPHVVQEASSLLQAHRLIKSDAEINAIEKAITLTQQSLLDVFPRIPSMDFEYKVQADIEYGIFKRGAKRLAFPSIVGAGKNTTYLHYEDNQAALNSGELLLMDVGAEWDYYAADITRTVPISGKFSPEQKAIYQLVLDAQTAAIQSVKPGVSWRKPHDAAVKVIASGLVDLGLLSGDVEQIIKARSYRTFFMHGTSHWLGLDVHDVGGRLGEDGKPRLLKAGMVLTVEPGIYISEAADVDPRWLNIGVRIEDDVLVTPKGHRVLSQFIPKTILEIESLMQP